jgi:hypothetical protein
VKYWFHGELEGHYVGRTINGSQATRVAGGETLRLEIYRALVRSMTIVAQIPDPPPAESSESSKSAPSETDLSDAALAATTPVFLGAQEKSTNAQERTDSQEKYHHPCSSESMHQNSIGQVHFLEALGPGSMVRGAAHDVLIDRLKFSDPARHNGKAYGRIEGRVSGWFTPPPPSPVRCEIAPPPVETMAWSSDLVVMHPLAKPTVASGAVTAAKAGHRNSAQSVQESSLPSPGGEDAPENATTTPESSTFEHVTDLSAGTESGKIRELPFLSLAAAISLGLAVAATPESAGLFLLSFLPAWLLRKWLIGVVPDVSGIRVLAVLMNVSVPLCGAMMLMSCASAGCKFMAPAPLFFIVGGTLLTSLLPRPLSMAICALTLGGVLLYIYGQWGLVSC